MAEINKGAYHEAEGRQRRRRGEIADHHVVRGEVRHRGDGPKGDSLGQRPIDRNPSPTGQRRLYVRPEAQENREFDNGSRQTDFALDGRAKIIPGRFVDKIKQGATARPKADRPAAVVRSPITT